jgi:hypothetical protein
MPREHISRCHGVVGLIAFFAFPVVSRAEGIYPACFPNPPSQEWVERCAAERKSGQEAEQLAAEAAARPAAAAAREAAIAAEKQAPAARLVVRAFSRHGASYAEPGLTAFSITSSLYAHITFRGDHGTGSSRFQFVPATEEEGGITEAGETGDVFDTHLIPRAPAPEAQVNIRWSCRLRGQLIHYTVQAQGGSGPPLVSTGVFRIRLTARWCIAAKHRESSEEAHHRAEERKEAAEAHRHELERYETNCRAIGGTPVEISTSEGRRVVCHSKTGGVIPVPT